jgi:hypothetical protein
MVLHISDYRIVLFDLFWYLDSCSCFFPDFIFTPVLFPILSAVSGQQVQQRVKISTFRKKINVSFHAMTHDEMKNIQSIKSLELFLVRTLLDQWQSFRWNSNSQFRNFSTLCVVLELKYVLSSKFVAFVMCSYSQQSFDYKRNHKNEWETLRFIYLAWFFLLYKTLWTRTLTL